jgi:hypothetical protein
MAIGLENRFHTGQAFCPDFGKLRAAMVNGRIVHRT